MSRRRFARVTVWLVFVSSAALAFCADVSLETLPAKAKEAILKLAGGNAILEVEAEKANGAQVYEAGWKSNGRGMEAKVTADGALVQMQETVAAEEIPAAVRASAEKALAGAKSVHFEKLTIVMYEAEGVVNGRAMEVVVSPLGTIGARDAEDDEDDDGPEDDDGDDDGHGDNDNHKKAKQQNGAR